MLRALLRGRPMGKPHHGTTLPSNQPYFRYADKVLRTVSLLLLLLTSLALGQNPAPPAPLTSPPAQVTIDQAIQEALQRNLNLLAERYNVTVADARILTARLRPNPVLTLEGDHLDLLGTNYDKDNQAGPAEYSGRIDFILERGGKRERRIELAENVKAVAQLQLLNTTRTLVLDVENAFVDVLLAKEALQLAQNNLKSFRSLVDVNAIRVRAGDLAPVELMRTEVAAIQLENAVNQAESRLRLALNRLQTVMGRVVFANNFDVLGEMRRESTLLVAAELQAQALQLRPDLTALTRDQARSLADLRLQVAQGKVDYTIGAEYRRQQGLAGTGNSLGVFFSSNLPVFNRNQGEIERARREGQQIEARIRALRVTIEAEIQNAFQQYSTARRTVERLEGSLLDRAKQVRDIMEYSYRRGEASLVEFLDAQRAYNDALQTYNEARAEYARTLYALDSATGK